MILWQHHSIKIHYYLVFYKGNALVKNSLTTMEKGQMKKKVPEELDEGKGITATNRRKKSHPAKFAMDGSSIHTHI
jgi:hypothetical protein